MSEPTTGRGWGVAAFRAAKALLPVPLKDAVKRALRARLATQPEPVQAAADALLREIRIAGDVRGSEARFRALRGRTGLKVHLGCGADVRPGWINIDLAPAGPGAAPAGDAPFIAHDLRRGLPLPEGSCDLIYSSHVLEHLEPQQGFRLLRDGFRALRPGGLLRTALPDFRRLFDAYLRGDAAYFDLVDLRKAFPGLVPGSETLLDHVAYGVYQNGEHKCLYDEEKLVRLLRQAGFRSAAASACREDLDPDTPVRRRYSFYVDAHK